MKVWCRISRWMKLDQNLRCKPYKFTPNNSYPGDKTLGKLLYCAAYGGKSIKLQQTKLVWHAEKIASTLP